VELSAQSVSWQSTVPSPSSSWLSEQLVSVAAEPEPVEPSVPVSVEPSVAVSEVVSLPVPEDPSEPVVSAI
jgi:hypothetical protein